MDLFVSRIQRFSTADGDGIRTTVFLQGCNLRCTWCHNPETQPASPQTLRFSDTKQEISGRLMRVDEVFAILDRDRDFYLESGGGVTISGGEPLLQAEAVADLLRLCRERNMHTLIDTAGCVPYTAFEAVLPYTDQFYFDIKCPDAASCKAHTGGDLALIADNLTRLCASGVAVEVRIPTIPGINDTAADFEKIIEIIRSAGATHASILPYHNYGESKYRALGRTYSFGQTARPDDATLQARLRQLTEAGLCAKIQT